MLPYEVKMLAPHPPEGYKHRGYSGVHSFSTSASISLPILIRPCIVRDPQVRQEQVSQMVHIFLSFSTHILRHILSQSFFTNPHFSLVLHIRSSIPKPSNPFIKACPPTSKNHSIWATMPIMPICLTFGCRRTSCLALRNMLWVSSRSVGHFRWRGTLLLPFLVLLCCMSFFRYFFSFLDVLDVVLNGLLHG